MQRERSENHEEKTSIQQKSCLKREITVLNRGGGARRKHGGQTGGKRLHMWAGLGNRGKKIVKKVGGEEGRQITAGQGHPH